MFFRLLGVCKKEIAKLAGAFFDVGIFVEIDRLIEPFASYSLVDHILNGIMLRGFLVLETFLSFLRA